MIDYTRCHFINAENGIQCESWHSKADGDMCPVHRGMVSTVLASNGVNKEEYLSQRRAAESSLRERLNGLDAQAMCNLLDAHIAGIEKIIEEQKTLALTARAIRSEVIEGMSEADRQIRRSMKVTVHEKEKTETKKRIKGTPEEQLKALMAKFPTMTEAGARMMLGLD